MAGWPDTSATFGKAIFTRGADTLTIGEGGAIKADLFPLRGRGPYTYSGVELSNGEGESPSLPTLSPLVVMLGCHLRGDVLLEDGSDASDHIEGMAANVAWLQTFCDPFSTAPGTHDSELWVPGVGIHEAPVGVHLELMLTDAELMATFGKVPLKVVVPNGRYVYDSEIP